MSPYLSIPKNFQSDDYYRFRKLNEIIQKLLNEKASKEITLIDVGCGDGQFMQYVKENCTQDIHFKFIGIEKYITENSFDFDLINEDIEEKLDLPDNFADIIVAAEIIEHLKNTDTFILELKRIAKAGSDILITTPNLSSYFNRFLLLFGYQPYNSEVSEVESGFGQGLVYKVLGRPKVGNKTAGHLRLFTFKAFKDFINFYEFKLIKFYPVYFSHFRKDNKRVFIIKLFFWLDKMISQVFPKLSNGMIFHLRK